VRKREARQRGTGGPLGALLWLDDEQGGDDALGRALHIYVDLVGELDEELEAVLADDEPRDLVYPQTRE